MKRFLAIALAATVGFFTYTGTASALSVDDYQAGDAANGIGGSRHNLGAYGAHIITDGTTEICVFCHAPHHGNPDTGPLWNRENAAASYTAYGSTIAGTGVGQPGGATLACLSCHDGITTFDTLINAPGKGNGLNGNNKLATDNNWSFTEDGGSVTDYLTSTRLAIGSSYQADGSIDVTGDVVTLTDDHPVSVAYTPGNASLRNKTAPLAQNTGNNSMDSIDLLDGLNSSAAGGYGGNLGQNRWAIAGTISDSGTISDLLRGTSDNVECSSCHDPHFSNKSWDETDATWGAGGEDDSDGLFLRRVGGNTGSGLCRTCHNK